MPTSLGALSRGTSASKPSAAHPSDSETKLESPTEKKAGETKRSYRASTADGDSEEDEEYVYFSKSYLVNIRHPLSQVVVRAVVMADDQAHQCYMHPDLPRALGLETGVCDYSLETLGGITSFSDASFLKDLQVQAYRGGTWYDVPIVKANRFLPDSRAERATDEIIKRVPHLKHLQDRFESEEPQAETMLILGLDADWLHKCKPYGRHAPYAHASPLGWAFTGKIAKVDLPEGCLAVSVPTQNIRLLRTGSLEGAKFATSPLFLPRHERWTPTEDIFNVREDDDVATWSSLDEGCMRILRDGVRISSDGKIEVPLPLRHGDTVLPDNRLPVFYRSANCLKRIARDEEKLKLCMAAMQLYLERGHVEIVPREEILNPINSLTFYLMVFPVFHPLKPSARLVFDAKAEFKGTSLNSVLLAGPDLNNTLRGVLLRFRANPVAFALDIAHMFNCFAVPESQKDLLRFFWWKDNDPTQPIVPYRSVVHLFGACSSPTVAVFALKLIAFMAEQEGLLTKDEAKFLSESFYIDDGMDSKKDEEEVIHLISKV